MNGSIDEDLIQRVLDGEATPDEEARLRELTVSAPEVRARYEELRRVFVALRDVPPVEPPPGQLETVLEGIRGASASARGRGDARQERSGWRDAVAAIRTRLTPSLGYAFAAGIVAGVALFGAFDGRLRSGLDGASPGTLLPSSRLAEAGVVDSARLDVDGFTGSVRTRALDGARVAEVECVAADGATLDLEFDPQALAILGFERDQASVGEVGLEPGRIRLTPGSGSRYRIWFDATGTGSSDLTVRVVSGGSSLERLVRTADAR